jgi:molecular chaperone DnaJ
MGEAKRDYYEVLGVPRVADPETLKKAFRSRARTLHPDVSDDPEAEEKFSELAEAYEVLSKPTARFLYDRLGYRGWGNEGLSEGAASPAGGDILDFAEARARRRDSGQDVLVEVCIGSVEAARGTTRYVQFAVVAACLACRGEGAQPGASWKMCSTCRGEGRLKTMSRSATGQLLQLEQCGGCAGRGRVASEECAECSGSRRVTLERTLDVRIPAGVRDGQRIRLTGDGVAESLAGQAYLVLRVGALPDTRFVRHASAVGLALALATLIALLFLS